MLVVPTGHPESQAAKNANKRSRDWTQLSFVKKDVSRTAVSPNGMRDGLSGGRPQPSITFSNTTTFCLWCIIMRVSSAACGSSAEFTCQAERPLLLADPCRQVRAKRRNRSGVDNESARDET